MLVGRDRECARLDRLLRGARAGEAKVLVLLGEPGIGKTALLDHAAAQAQGTVVRTVGLESEAQLEFSALFDVCRPLLDHVPALPQSQAQALETAFGIGSGPAGDRFLVGAATLSLLAAAGEDAPLLVLVDDAQWIDGASADALLFAARRLAAERVAMLVCARGDDGVFGAGGLESIRLGGVDDRATAALLASSGVAGLASGVVEQLARETGGSPLALLELSTALTERQLRGQEPIGDLLPVGSRICHAFAERALELPRDAQQALLVAAVSSSVRLEPIVDAVRRIGLDERSLEAAEDAGLVHIDRDGVRFRHPLVRSAVVQTAAASERRRAHRALADALADDSPDERAWHLSAAALGFDEQAATELAQAAVRTRARSGWAPAALALERSARLTRDPDTRADRLLDAAESAMVGGQIELTLSLTDELLANQDGAARRARVIRLRGQIELHCGDVGHALDHLLEGADLLARDDPAAATAMLADAIEAAELLGKPRRALQAAAAADALRTGHEPHGLLAEFALGQALRLAGRPADARPHLERALTVLTSGGEPRASMRAFTRGAHAAGWLDRVPEGLDLARCAVDAAREQGAFGPLAHALEVTADLDATAGRWREAHGHASEALELARASRCAWALTRCLEHLAWLEAAQGNEERCRAHAAEADAVATGAGFHSDRARAAIGLLELGLGRVDDAARVFDAIDPAALERIGAGDFVEALIRGGRTDKARAALERIPAGQKAVAARYAGLLADDDFEAPFAQALARHAEHDAFGRARTRLCLGERRRRAGRRVDARTELRAASEVFGRLGARPWAERAASELRATGERLGRREARPGDELTPQELQVALQAAEGRTNKEIGAALFLSPKTVDFHLRRVFRKLDMRSRGELIRHFAVTGR